VTAVDTIAAIEQRRSVKHDDPVHPRGGQLPLDDVIVFDRF